MKLFDADAIGETILRRLAGRTSRRGILSRAGLALVAAPVFPLLPVSRAQASKPDRSAEARTAFARNAQAKDDTKCDYWRYCAIDGFLCTCCGGSVNTCPPGTEMSPITWIGTCTNPADNRAYIISYNDCCGTSSCGQCLCNRNEGDRPQVRTQSNNDYNWCLGSQSSVYNCSTAVIVGVALDQPR